MSHKFLLYGVDDRVASITLNRPERHNALSQARAITYGAEGVGDHGRSRLGRS
jgi:hypothetical protein